MDRHRAKKGRHDCSVRLGTTRAISFWEVGFGKPNSENNSRIKDRIAATAGNGQIFLADDSTASSRATSVCEYLKPKRWGMPVHPGRGHARTKPSNLFLRFLLAYVCHLVKLPHRAAMAPATATAAAAKLPIPLTSAATFPVCVAAPEPEVAVPLAVSPWLGAAAPVADVTIVVVQEQSEL